MSTRNSIVVTRTLSVPAEKVWSLITDNNRVNIYFPFVKNASSETIKLDTIRVSVSYWDGLFGTIRERCVNYEPGQGITWHVEEDSRKVFQPGFIWSIQLESKSIAECEIRFIASYESKNQIRSSIESFRLKMMFKKSLQSIQTALVEKAALV